jgi:predicted AlkP superfamily phosphohydrolase/phosphomutase
MRLAVRLTAVLTLIVLCPLPGCRPAPTAPVSAGPILVLGIDGAEWSVIEPLIEGGELPNLARLIEGGASGRLRSLEPLQGSPVIWTTIATGKPPEAHGVRGFVREGGGAADFHNEPYSSNMWTASAFWDVLGANGLRVGVVGWLVTWPPWEVNGFMVSQYVHRMASFGGSDAEKGVTYPAELGPRIAPLVASLVDVGDDDLARFVNLESELGLDAVEGRSRDVLIEAVRSDEAAVGVALELIGDEGLDLVCVYMRGLDETCHGFWVYRDPEARPPVDPAHALSVTLEKQAEALSGTIDEYCRYTDEMVGRVLEAFPDDTTVIVVSDHGFEGPGPWGADRIRMGIEQHSPDGVLIMNGPGVVPGRTIEGARVHDIAPTILTIAGLPVGRDMEGEVLTDAFTREFARTHPVRFVETHETDLEKGVDEEPIESPVDDEVREQLRSLGYIE